MSAPTWAHPDRRTRVQRVEALARRAEEAAIERNVDALPGLLAEMAREMFRMAHALDGVV